MQRYMGPPLGPLSMQPPFQAASGFMQAAPMFQGAQAASYAPYAGQTAGLARGFGGLSAAGRGGGLLARLFGGGSSQAAGSSIAGGIGRAAAGASGTMNFTTILQNTQRVLGLTQQVVPMVQQYGPLIRNMPAIWRIMRSNDIPTPEVATPVNQEPIMQQHVPIVPQNESTTMSAPLATRPVKPPVFTNGLPSPKLYI
ncbi:VrrA/YqfQ family protein [Alkalihalophilus sp. As8PL]|uniref:VrrA/YqfQ family protein n=1 Tax=Alkalihalophilus sp. As8PL TaxID=3237103 RepID=A0AB39BV38_9BACI